MEKNFVSLNQVRYQDLILAVRDAARVEADTIPTFRDKKNGCIRIVMVPLTPQADQWLGGMSTFGEDRNDICERDFSFKIHPEGSHTAKFPCDLPGVEEPVNCYGYTALKVASASLWRQKSKDESFMAEMRQFGFLKESNGYALCDGVYIATVKINQVDFMRMYVAVSGATAKEDLQPALAGTTAIAGFFTTAIMAEVDQNIQSAPEDRIHEANVAIEEIPAWAEKGFPVVD